MEIRTAIDLLSAYLKEPHNDINSLWTTMALLSPRSQVAISAVIWNVLALAPNSWCFDISMFSLAPYKLKRPKRYCFPSIVQICLFDQDTRSPDHRLGQFGKRLVSASALPARAGPANAIKFLGVEATLQVLGYSPFCPPGRCHPVFFKTQMQCWSVVLLPAKYWTRK